MVDNQHDFYVGAAQSLSDGLVGVTHTLNGVHVATIQSLASLGVSGTLHRAITEQVYRIILGVSHFTGWLLESALRHVHDKVYNALHHWLFDENADLPTPVMADDEALLSDGTL